MKWFWQKHPAEGGAEARRRSEEALRRAKEQRQRAEQITSRVEDLKVENHFSQKVEYMIRTGRAE